MTLVSAQLKLDVTIPAEGGIELGAWLFLPEGDGVRPAITVAHGFGGTREHGLERFAQAFAAAGFVVLVHDHRNFGMSGGDLRGDIDPWQQIADWRRAISYLESRPEVDPTRIGLWGTSYAGGHALVRGATDRRLRCVVAQIPTISGTMSRHAVAIAIDDWANREKPAIRARFQIRSVTSIVVLRPAE